MKIIDWENYIFRKYKIIEKTRDYDRIQDFIIDYSKKEFYIALKRSSFVIYISKDIDGFSVLYGKYNNQKDQIKMVELAMEYFDLYQNEPFDIEKQISFYVSKGFQIKKLEELSESEQKYYFESLEFTIESLTEGYINDNDFYKAYIFDDIEIFGNGVRKYNSGFSNTIVVIASEDGENISNYFVHWGGFCEPEEFDIFLKNIDVNKN